MAMKTVEADSAKAKWIEALSDYRAKRSASDAIPLDNEGADEAVDAYCQAMDHLIESVPAPDLSAAILKMELMKERFEGFDYPEATTTAVMADLKRLAATQPSLILQLHARFEQIWEAHHRLDCAQPAKSTLDPSDLDNFRLYYSCERAMGELAQESDLVQRLLLRQVPETDEEATVQALHARNLYDSGDDLSEGDRQAIEVALVNVADYLIGEGRADMERLGKQFSAAAMHCWSQRRHRQGLTDDNLEVA